MATVLELFRINERTWVHSLFCAFGISCCDSFIMPCCSSKVKRIPAAMLRLAAGESGDKLHHSTPHAESESCDQGR